MVIKLRNKGTTVGGTCNSCGAKPVLDNIHKLAAFILKYPPKNISEFRDDEEKGKKSIIAPSKDDKKGKKSKKTDKHGKESSDNEEKKEIIQEKPILVVQDKKVSPVKAQLTTEQIGDYCY